jgi:hypothetical protein
MEDPDTRVLCAGLTEVGLPAVLLTVARAVAHRSTLGSLMTNVAQGETVGQTSGVVENDPIHTTGRQNRNPKYPNWPIRRPRPQGI